MHKRKVVAKKIRKLMRLPVPVMEKCWFWEVVMQCVLRCERIMGVRTEEENT